MFFLFALFLNSVQAATINISVNPTTIDFGNVTVGQSSDQTITITNQASSYATLTGSVGGLPAPFSVQSGGGSFSLTPGQSVTVTVRFSPTAEGAAAANLLILHNATNQTNPTSIPLRGTGVFIIYVDHYGLCGGKNVCFSSMQDGIDSAQSFTIIEITQETYYEDVIFDDPKVVTLQGGWDTNFTSSSSYTTINGSITITNGTMIFEYIILE